MDTNLTPRRMGSARPEATWKGVYRTLREAILGRELPPASRLIEADLARSLGVSRTPLREALARLEIDGLVETSVKSGGYIVSDVRQHLVDAYHLRAAIEGYGVRLAANRVTKDELAALRKNVDSSERVPYANRKQRARHNLEFHQILAAASHSPKILHGFNNIRDLILTDGDMGLHSEGAHRQFVREHSLIVLALEMRDGDLAERIVRQHLMNAVDLLLNRLRDADAGNPN